MNHRWAKSIPELAWIADNFGQPAAQYRSPTLATLVHIILEQQISVAAAATQFKRLCASLGGISGKRLANAGEPGLRRLGLTRQKARYCAGLGHAICERRFSLAKIQRLDEDQALAELTALPGIGPWTGAIFLMMAMRKPDVWPAGDLALLRVAADLAPSDSDDGERFRPWRTTAAFYYWHYYRATH